jgi:phosphoribosylformylglycinamidine synthase
VDVDAVLAAQSVVRDAVRADSVSSAHDIAEGGLLVAVAECCLAGDAGAILELEPTAEDVSTQLFGEAPGGFVVSGERAALEALGDRSVPVRILGEVGGDVLQVAAGTTTVAATLAELRTAHGALAALFA